MVATDDLSEGTKRLLEVDYSLNLPAHAHLHFLISSTDVLHS
jgi:hypothetical protein